MVAGKTFRPDLAAVSINAMFGAALGFVSSLAGSAVGRLGSREPTVPESDRENSVEQGSDEGHTPQPVLSQNHLVDEFWQKHCFRAQLRS